MLKASTTRHKVEDVFAVALNALTDDIHVSGYKSGPLSAAEIYQHLCVREVVRGMIAARLLAESMQGPMLQDDLHSVSSKMLDALASVYPVVGLSGSSNEAVEKLSKLGSVSAWKIHTRIMNLLKPQKKERPFPIPFWPASQLRAA